MIYYYKVYKLVYLALYIKTTRFSKIILDKDAPRLIKEEKRILSKIFQFFMILAFKKTMILFIKILFLYIKFNIYLR